MIFFSYSHTDASDFALRLYSDLQKVGADVWIDQLDITGGKRWDVEISKALKACPCVLFI
ncbi:MAG: toll/interleukin-1 receptor domain-containing protein, partial [Flavisolibacter sp.]|nr:toll/interleukin-1 receptor domain-containing protein [Flavisolibacter sp.]